MSTKVILYSLSTDVWSREAKRLLDQLGIQYICIDVDLLTGDTKVKADAAVRNINPDYSFPVLSVGDKHFVGYDEQKIKNILIGGV